MKIYNGNDLALALAGLGLSCKFVECKTTPQAIKYYFNLNNIKDRKKISSIVLDLQTQLKEKIIIREGEKVANFCIEFERKEREFVHFPQVFHHLDGKTNSVLFGIDENNQPLIYELDKMPHLLIAGTTGSGKSAFINNLIMNLILKNPPNKLSLILIDPKIVEFSIYKNIPHLCRKVVQDTETAINILNDLVFEMQKRYKKLDKQGLNFNSNQFSKIIVVIDELADLMLSSKKEVETPIVRLAQKGRACGIHLVLATQRPTVNVITGLIKANIPCRVAFQTSSIRDSIVLLDQKGAENLKGLGDGLVKLPDRVEPIRVQAPFISRQDILQIVYNPSNKPNKSFWKIVRKITKITLKILLSPLIVLIALIKSRRIKKQYKSQYIKEFTINGLNFFDCIDNDF